MDRAVVDCALDKLAERFSHYDWAVKVMKWASIGTALPTKTLW